jgi:hypothetical protein
VRAADDTLDATLRTMVAAIAPMISWQGVVRSQVADAAGPSSRVWRTMLQVFLI